MASVTDAVNVERHKVTVHLMVIVLYHIIYLSLSAGATEDGELGTHILQFFWSSAFTQFSHPLAYFVTNTATTEETIRYFWKGVSSLQKAGLQVIASVFDGSPANRRLQV